MNPGILIRCALAVALTAIGPSALAHHELERSGAEATALKDGATLWTFKDHKMAVEDKLGRARAFETGRRFETTDGRFITATSNESARLRSLIRKGHKGGGG